MIANRRTDFFNRQVQSEFHLNPANPFSAGQSVGLSDRRIPMAMIRNPRARRYVLRLQADGSARVTIPRGGSIAEARRFAERHAWWLERALRRQAARPASPTAWRIGTRIYFRGELMTIEAGANGESSELRLGPEAINAKDGTADVRRVIERHLWSLAAKELPPRVVEYARIHRLAVRRITVRNQRSRWGSCSRRGTISLNWRLIQVPPFVRDYLILHELMHLKQMNHSARFWREVERVCPDYRTAERWLKQHSALLR